MVSGMFGIKLGLLDKPAHKSTGADTFLPDFCGLRMVFMVVLVTELFAFVLVLAPSVSSLGNRWQHLAFTSLFMQWVALASSGLLCLVRPWLGRLNTVQATSASYLIILLVTSVISWLSLWVLHDPDISHIAGFIIRNVTIAGIIAAPVLRYFYVQHQWRRRIQAESQARLQALQSRIRPHFLFNSMNTIASLIRVQPGQAEAAVENLSDLFRASLGEATRMYSLGEEFELCRRYLDIEAMRLGERLKIDWQVSALPRDARIPPLLLQPLLENAIYHGIEPSVAGGTISIHGNESNGQLHITIRNPFSASDTRQRDGNHLAVGNIRERLEACYGRKAGLELTAATDYFEVVINLPYRNQDDDDAPLDRG